MATFEELKQALTDAIAEVDLAEDDILAAEDAVAGSLTSLTDSRGKLDKATTRHMQALKALVTANVNLNNWVPPAPEPDPEPPAPAVLGFHVGRMLHEQDTRFSVTEQARLWEFQVIQGDVWKLPMVQQLRQADPKATLLRPGTWTARRANDPNGYGTLLPPAAIPDHWLLRNSTGQILYRDRDGDQLVDPGNPSYREAAANRLLQLFRDQPYWTGLWVDEVIGDWNWWNAVNMSGTGPRTSGGVLYTRVEWQTAVLGLVNYIAQRLQAAGVEVWANLSSTSAFPATDAWSRAIVTATTGTTQEFFIARGNEPVATLENGVYRATLEWLNYLNSTGRKYHMHAQTASPQLADYAAGAFALMADPTKGFFSAGRDPYPVRDQLDTPLMQVLRRTGAPKGTQVGGTRPFANGTMRINASTQASSTLPPMTARWEPA